MEMNGTSEKVDITVALKLKALEEILESSEFKESKRYSDLLRYLVTETISGNVPKEITIGINFFEKGNNFDPKEDPTVRVYINNLRKKIEHYYFTQTPVSKYKISIPKGHYEVEFTEIQNSANEKKLDVKEKKYLSLLLPLTILLAIVVIYQFVNNHESSSSKNFILTEFVEQNPKPTLIVLGDFYFLYERSDEPKGGHFIRDMRVNTQDEYRNLIKSNPDFGKRYIPADFTYLRPSAGWGIAELIPILKSEKNNYSIKLASQITLDDLNSHNIIFIGSFKTLFLLKSFIHLYGLSVDFSSNKFTLQKSDTDSLVSYTPENMKGGNYQKDYALVLKGDGPNQSKVLMLMGFSDIGVLDAVKAVTEESSVQMIEKKLSENNISTSSGFSLVIKTEGMSQAIFSSQIQLINRIQKKAITESDLLKIAQ